VDGLCSGQCSVMAFGIRNVQTSGSVIRDLTT